MKKRLKNITLATLTLFLLTYSIIKVSGAFLENGVQVREGEELTYYISVEYDGKDVNGISSSDDVKANVTSDIIKVEDRIPDGLIFNGFVTTENGEIGAVSRANEEISCLGYVIDGVNGLHYDETTRIVSFEVKSLQAGCVLNVGIKTKTPVLGDDVKRLDFYNTAIAVEGLDTAISNTIHTWIGLTSTERETKYTVTYELEGTKPENVPKIPEEREYIEGSNVSIDQTMKMPGYIFSGWTIKDDQITVTDNVFTMPNKNVTLVGSFTKDSTFIPYKVTYNIEGTNIPEDYVTPKEKEYYPNETVDIDVLKEGDVYKGYRFSGWKINNTNITIEENVFSMPKENVTLTGSWELVTYKVEYQFMGDIIPPNSEQLLPETKSYRPGSNIKLEDITSPNDYEFLGWYHIDNFEMPEEDIIIYGEWKYKTKKFTPTITKEVVNKQEYFSNGDKVKFEITVTAPTETDIFDVYIKENNEKAKFIAGTGYEVITDTIVKITELKAGESITLTSEYIVTAKDENIVTNEVSIIGALANNNYEFDKTLAKTATDNFKVDAELKICNTVNNGKNKKTIQYHITGTEYESWVVLGENECQNIYLLPGNYNIFEIEPQDYDLIKVTGAIKNNNTSFTAEEGKEYEAIFEHNYNKKGFYHTFGSIINIIENIGK